MTRPRQLLKWWGGKERHKGEILAALPTQIDTYYEPFVGGGKIFWELARERRFRRACLSDTNRELITTYSAIRDDVEAVIAAIRRIIRKPFNEQAYYELRNKAPRTAAGVAARMLVLNRTCFNGQYRVNLKGEFNVPYGDYRNPSILDEGTLREASELLQGVTLIDDHYLWAIAAAEPGDAVYLDPPYFVYGGREAGFVEYGARVFDREAHERLVKHCRLLSDRGVHWVASNSDTAWARARYSWRGVHVRALAIGRTVGAKASTRKPTTELLIWHEPGRAAKIAAEG